MNRVGQGFDVHKFIKSKPLIIGGVKIDFDHGLEGHSDADVLIHAIIDALLGAAALGDIGHHFPDSDKNFKDIDSRKLLRNVVEKLKFISFEDERKNFFQEDNQKGIVTNSKYQKKIKDVKNEKIKKSLIELTRVFKEK